MGRYLAFFIVLCAALVTTAGCWAQDESIWQIGKSDNDYSEFAIAGRYGDYSKQFKNGVKFEIGKSTSEKDWPYIQPGPADNWAGAKPHSQEINFDLSNQPAGIYALRMDLVSTNSISAPVIDVSINGKSNIYYLSPGAPDSVLTNPSVGIEQVIIVCLSSRTLHNGRNIIRITSKSGSWLLYDCISFGKCPNPPKAIENLTLSSSCLFKKNNGKLSQVLNAFVNLRERCNVRAEITEEDGANQMQFFTDVPAGRSRMEIEVPPAVKPKNVHVKLSVDNECVEADGQITPQKHWRIYILPTTHLDIGYTDLQSRAMQVHDDNLERAMSWCSRYPGFKWDLEGAYNADWYFRSNAHARMLADRVRKDQIGIMGFFANELTGICSGEELSRLVDYYDSFRRKFGTATECAMMNDVPTMTAAIPMVLAGHGIKYLSIGVNNEHTSIAQDMYDTPYYWQAPDGSRVLMWKTMCYGQATGILGIGESATLEILNDILGSVLKKYTARQDYPFDAILIHGAYSDNCRNFETIASIPDEWNRKYEYPKFLMSRGAEFFKYIEANFPQYLKTVNGDGGAWWEDGAASSAAETACVREAKRTLITAEKMAALCKPSFQKRTKKQFSEAWKNVLLYDEHTWGAAQSISAPDSEQTLKQWAVKKQFADQAARLADDLLSKSFAEYGAKVHSDADAILVFNPSGFARKGVVFAQYPCDMHSVPMRGTAPPLGCIITPANLACKTDETKAEGDTLENKFYRICFDKNTGAVKSIYDKELKRELVDSKQHGLNQYLYVRGGDNSALVNTGGPKPDLRVEANTRAAMEKYMAPGRQGMRIKSSAAMAKSFSSEIVLYDGEKRIDFINKIDKIPTTAKEAGYFAFPFAFKRPNIRIEVPNGVIRPEEDMLPGGCRDWYAVDQFLTISDNSAAVALSPIDSPIITLQDINRGQRYKQIKIENGNMFAYVFNNYWYTNYKASQGGELTFRFSMTSNKRLSDARAKQFGEEVQYPLIARWIRGTSHRINNVPKTSVRINSRNVILQAMKPAKYNDGIILRLREMAGRSWRVKVAVCGIKFKRAYLCNLAEDKLCSVPVSDHVLNITCKALGLTTVLLER